MSLVAAANQRQDDLRETVAKYQEIIGNIRKSHNKELSAAESRRIDAVIMAESRRVDALLAAQSQSVALASEKTAAQAATLATQVLANAENVRSQTAVLRDSLEGRIKVIEQNQYQAGGAKTQQSEGQKTNQWVIQVVITVIIFIVGLMLSRMWPAH
jgi:thiol:disulfide interchange protein